MSEIFVIAEVGWKALPILYGWLLAAIISAELSRSKGYGEKPGLGTGLILHLLGPVVWLFVPPKDETAEWHQRKPWQPRRRVKESELAPVTGAGGPAAGDPGAGSRPG